MPQPSFQVKMNEVSDLQALLAQVATFSNRLEQKRHSGHVVTLKLLLNRVRDQLRALDNVIHVELMKGQG
jgi:hypothetical protein